MGRKFFLGGMQISSSFAQMRFYTVSCQKPLQGSAEFCFVFVPIRLANQMLMLVNGSVARQGSCRMVIRAELTHNKEAGYLSHCFCFFFLPEQHSQIQAFTCGIYRFATSLNSD